jgi:hypothetical protein
MTLNFRTLGSFATFALLSLNACAQASAVNQGPYLPPALRSPPPSTPASGQALRNEAMDKLKKRFQEADLDANGRVTREEAKRAGLGYVENNFDEIDTGGHGQVSFDDVRTFMTQRIRK